MNDSKEVRELKGRIERLTGYIAEYHTTINELEKENQELKNTLKKQVFKQLQKEAYKHAFDLGCDTALINAVSFSRSTNDFENLIKHAHGPGAEDFANWLNAKL